MWCVRFADDFNVESEYREDTYSNLIPVIDDWSSMAGSNRVKVFLVRALRSIYIEMTKGVENKQGPLATVQAERKKIKQGSGRLHHDRSLDRLIQVFQENIL